MIKHIFYKNEKNFSVNINITNSTRLGLVLNYSVFYTTSRRKRTMIGTRRNLSGGKALDIT